ncbi:uncharacterized protein DEA37_0004976, partial [Paragonimus westermani]
GVVHDVHTHPDFLLEPYCTWRLENLPDIDDRFSTILMFVLFFMVTKIAYAEVSCDFISGHQTGAISTTDLEKKLQEILGQKVTVDQVKQIAAALNENVPASVKDTLIDKLSKQLKLPPDVVTTLKGLAGGAGFHQAGSMVLLTASVILYLPLF